MLSILKINKKISSKVNKKVWSLGTEKSKLTNSNRRDAYHIFSNYFGVVVYGIIHYVKGATSRYFELFLGR